MAIKESHALKGLQVREKKLEVEVQQLKADMQESNKRYLDTLNKLKSLKEEITKLQDSNKDIIISEHAYLRYIERAMGLDLEALKQEMLPNATLAQIKTLGNGKYPIGNGVKIVVKDSVVVSVV